MSKTSNKNLEEFYKKALSDETTSEELEYIWDNTTSVRIRKAIASNPACSAKLLRKCARLYLEEVLNNDSFELLSTFTTSDEWINNVYLAKLNPKSFVQKSSCHSLVKKKDLCLTSLYSENLDIDTLFSICRWGSREVLRRAAKNTEVKYKIANQVRDFINDTNSGCDKDKFTNPGFIAEICYLYLEGLINLEDFNNYIKQAALFSTYIPSTAYNFLKHRALKDITKKPDNDSEVDEYAKTFLYLVLASRSYTVKYVRMPSTTVYDKNSKLNLEESLFKTFASLKLGLLLIKHLDKVKSDLSKSLGSKVSTRVNSIINSWINPGLDFWAHFINYYVNENETQIQTKVTEDLYLFLGKNDLLPTFKIIIERRGNRVYNLQNPIKVDSYDLSHEARKYFSEVNLIS